MALVRDWLAGEQGPQRKRASNGRLLHCCCICGKLETWGDGWSTYCSEKDIDDSAPIPKFCSLDCRSKGGTEARNVTEEMKRTAKDAEWREPTPVYREQTEREKYSDATDAQRRRSTPPSLSGRET